MKLSRELYLLVFACIYMCHAQSPFEFPQMTPERYALVQKLLESMRYGVPAQTNNGVNNGQFAEQQPYSPQRETSNESELTQAKKKFCHTINGNSLSQHNDLGAYAVQSLAQCQLRCFQNRDCKAGTYRQYELAVNCKLHDVTSMEEPQYLHREDDATYFDSHSCTTDNNENCRYIWADWGECTSSCFGGVHTRTVHVIDEPTGDGAKCPKIEQESCNQAVTCPEFFVGLFRQMNPQNGNHNYGNTENEYCGWNREATAGAVINWYYGGPWCPEKRPLFRKIGPRPQQDRMLTLNAAELNWEGYTVEIGVGQCVESKNNMCGATVPLYRIHRDFGRAPNGAKRFDHFYTHNATERRETLVNSVAVTNKLSKKQ